MNQVTKEQIIDFLSGKKSCSDYEIRKHFSDGKYYPPEVDKILDKLLDNRKVTCQTVGSVVYYSLVEGGIKTYTWEKKKKK